MTISYCAFVTSHRSIHLLVMLALFMGTWSAVPTFAAPTAALGPNACHIGAPDIEARDICFTPARVALAEARMPASLVRPRGIVWRLTGLRLRHLLLRVNGRPFALVFLYGRVPLTIGPVQEFSLSLDRPHYILVSENTTLGSWPAKPVDSDGHWEYGVNLRCRHLSLFVTTNISAVMAALVVRHLQSRAHCTR
jgi:hypothetical protein